MRACRLFSSRGACRLRARLAVPTQMLHCRCRAAVRAAHAGVAVSGGGVRRQEAEPQPQLLQGQLRGADGGQQQRHKPAAHRLLSRRHVLLVDQAVKGLRQLQLAHGERRRQAATQAAPWRPAIAARRRGQALRCTTPALSERRR